MRAKSVLLLMLALGCGLIASIGITQVMAKRNSEPAPPTGEVAAIFVAMEDIPVGEPITAQMIKLEEWPDDKVPPGALCKIEDVETRRPKTKIYQGSPILENQLLSKGAAELGASGQIPKGLRVAAVRVDSVSGGSGMIRPGDRVDVLVHLQRNPGREIPETTTRTILQDIKVFAVNDVYDLDSTDGREKITAQTISLLVTPAQAEKVMLASQLGDVRLVMRSPEDDEEVATSGADPGALFGITESADRYREGLAGAAQDESMDMNEFLRFLNSQGEEELPTVEPPAPPQTWTIRKIEGSEVTEVVMQLAEQDDSPDGPSPGFSLWRMFSSSVRGSGHDTADEESDADDAEEGESESEHDEEQDDEDAEEADDWAEEEEAEPVAD